MVEDKKEKNVSKRTRNVFCTNCGTKNRKTVTYCKRCGQGLNEDEYEGLLYCIS